MKTRKSLFLLATILAPLGAGFAYAASKSSEPPKEMTVEIDMAEVSRALLNPIDVELSTDSPEVMNLAHWPVENFHRDLTERTQKLVLAFDQERFDVFLDVAEIYLSQMLLFEARSVLEDIEADKQFNMTRWQALFDATSILDLQPVDTMGNSPLFQEDRADREFWLTLNAIAEGDSIELRNRLQPGVGGLALQSPAVIQDVLPALSEAAIALDNLPLAEQLVQLMHFTPDLHDSSVRNYLRGRIAFEKGDLFGAWDYYALAADEWDRYAARARIELVDIAITDGQQQTLVAAKNHLEHGREAWRGDLYELQVLQREAELFSLLDKPIEALMTHGRLIQRFPGTAEAIAAGEKAANDLQHVYKQGAMGQMALSDWLNVHFELVPIYRYFEDFGTYTVFLADTLLEKGASDFAVREYERALELLTERTVQRQSPAYLMEAASLRLKIATAMVEGGQPDKALMVLAEMGPPTNSEQSQTLFNLMIRAYADKGDIDQLLDTPLIAPDAYNIRATSRALYQVGRWQEATMFFNRLWNQHPEDFRIDDATYLLMAARNAGDNMSATKVIDAFPDLTTSNDWQVIASTLLDKPVELEPFTNEAVGERIQSFENALEHTQNSGL